MFVLLIISMNNNRMTSVNKYIYRDAGSKELALLINSLLMNMFQ